MQYKTQNASTVGHRGEVPRGARGRGGCRGGGGGEHIHLQGANVLREESAKDARDQDIPQEVLATAKKNYNEIFLE